MSNLTEVKEVAKTFLYLDISKTQFAPIVIQHPFFDSGIVMLKETDKEGRIGNIIENEADLKLARKIVEQQINKVNSVVLLGVMITKPYRLVFLKHIEHLLSPEDTGKYLASIWTSIENINMDINVTKHDIIRFFRNSDKQALMTKPELEVIEAWDNSIPIYRGITAYNKKQVKGLCWTTNIRTARYFANRFNEGGTVYEAHVDKEHILAHFQGRSEAEMVVDYRYLKEVKAIERIKASGKIVLINN